MRSSVLLTHQSTLTTSRCRYVPPYKTVTSPDVLLNIYNPTKICNLTKAAWKSSMDWLQIRVKCCEKTFAPLQISSDFALSSCFKQMWMSRRDNLSQCKRQFSNDDFINRGRKAAQPRPMWEITAPKDWFILQLQSQAVGVNPEADLCVLCARPLHRLCHLYFCVIVHVAL